MLEIVENLADAVYFEECGTFPFAKSASQIGDEVVAPDEVLLHKVVQSVEKIFAGGACALLVQRENPIGEGEQPYGAFVVAYRQYRVTPSVCGNIPGGSAGVAIGNDSFCPELVECFHRLFGEERVSMNG